MEQLHILLLPIIAHGHMIPMIDMAKLFTSRGLKTTIISTPAFADPIRKAQDSGFDIGLEIVNFPPEGSDLPPHMVSLDQMTGELIPKFVKALSLLQEPVESLLREIRPDALVSDTFLTWSVDSAKRMGIPRMAFLGTSYFAMCALEQMNRYKPYKDLESDSDSFDVPEFPNGLSLVRSQVNRADMVEEGNKDEFSKMVEQMWEANWRSFGVLVNSFYELEPDYADYYRNVLGRKAWHVGPLLMSSSGGTEEKALRGKKSAIDAHECLAWLDSKMPNSVVYVCFGSMTSFTPSQLREKAIGLEASGQNFIWVLRQKVENEDWLPEGFESRTKGKGLIIRGWAPQVLILDHPAIGAFVTHCGWNSTLEGVTAGVPMVTWPVFAEQFLNEKLVTNVLRTGVSVGNKKWMQNESEGVSSEAVAKAIKDVMLGEEGVEMRKRAKYLKKMAQKAVEEGGSSYQDLNLLIEELGVYQAPNEEIVV